MNADDYMAAIETRLASHYGLPPSEQLRSDMAWLISELRGARQAISHRDLTAARLYDISNAAAALASDVRTQLDTMKARTEDFDRTRAALLAG